MQCLYKGHGVIAEYKTTDSRLMSAEYETTAMMERFLRGVKRS